MQVNCQVVGELIGTTAFFLNIMTMIFDSLGIIESHKVPYVA